MFEKAFEQSPAGVLPKKSSFLWIKLSSDISHLQDVPEIEGDIDVQRLTRDLWRWGKIEVVVLIEC